MMDDKECLELLSNHAGLTKLAACFLPAFGPG